MEIKKAFFSVDLELLTDIKEFRPFIREEPNYIEEIKKLLKLLDKYDIKATFFACYNYILENKYIIELILSKGHDLGFHYLNHRNESINIDKFIKEVKYAKNNIEKMFQIELIGYRAPLFNLSNEQYQVLSDLGFKYDSSYFAYSKANYYAKFKPDNSLVEFPVWPINKYPLAGGAYLRLLPNFIIKRKLKSYLKKETYYNFYVHPYDYSIKNILIRKTPLKLKLFFNRGVKTYLDLIKWLIKHLINEGYKFKLYRKDL